MLPDLTSQKVYLPAFVYILLHLFVPLDKYSMTFLFGIAYYISLRVLTNLTVSKTDILLPSTVFFILPSMGSIYYDTGVFMLVNAFSRMILPSD